MRLKVKLLRKKCVNLAGQLKQNAEIHTQWNLYCIRERAENLLFFKQEGSLCA